MATDIQPTSKNLLGVIVKLLARVTNLERKLGNLSSDVPTTVTFTMPTSGTYT